MGTTIDNITAEQCGILAAESAQAGDLEMHRIAIKAMESLEEGKTDTLPIRRCVEVIQDAEAQVDT